MVSSAADCIFWQRELRRHCRLLYELKNKEQISVAAASKLLANIVYTYKGMGLSMGTMVAGWDKTEPNIFYIDTDGTHQLVLDLHNGKSMRKSKFFGLKNKTKLKEDEKNFFSV
ncbi:hypothetical protein RhiirA4_488002 [Rhizophagus irregularis]|uniref:Uncharacterized protein n=1 Tax=Rhizophagus irregularis TaxID=588596 RepID=A0A2I1HTB7_9GLOM|nr:hypothetical protein RhiirA4_488002 [Rhizophagus irregularis]